jgi:DNA replication ATP-dependent helicase Dna2
MVYLTHQYRMNSDIMSLSNRLIYHDRLKCGSEGIAERGLQLPHPERFTECCKHVKRERPCWIPELLDERLESSH